MRLQLRSPGWWAWLSWTITLCLLPACMMAVWGKCYATQFGVPGPYYPWSAGALDVLFGSTCAAGIVYVVRFSAKPATLILSLLTVLGAAGVAGFIWMWGGASVAGYFL
jgi:hypothetical protein